MTTSKPTDSTNSSDTFLRCGYKTAVLILFQTSKCGPMSICYGNKSHAIAGKTARCRCKFRYISKFTAASRGFHCDSNAFGL